jgi:hypothetical protein
MAASSDMLISAAVLLPRKELGISVALIERLCQCSDDVERLVDFTLVFPSGEFLDKRTQRPMEFEHLIRQVKDAFSTFSCEEVLRRGLALLNVVKESRTEDVSLAYPAPLMRRIARRAIESAYTLELELGMVPSLALCAVAVREIEKMQDGEEALRVFVVPGEALSHSC